MAHSDSSIPAPERVKIYTGSHIRPGRNSPDVTLVYTANGRRIRKSFPSLDAAEIERARIERLLEFGHTAAAESSADDLAMFHICKDKLRPFGLTVLEAVDFCLKHRDEMPAPPSGRMLIPTLCREFVKSRSTEHEFSARHAATVRQHLARFAEYFRKPIDSLRSNDIDDYLLEEIGGAPKSRKNHLITIRSLFHYAQRKGLLPTDKPTAADGAENPQVKKAKRQLFFPNDLMRVMLFLDERMLAFTAMRAFTGCRTAEAERVRWKHWIEHANRFEFDTDVTKTERRRLVEVEPCLAEWLTLFRGVPEDKICPFFNHDRYFRDALRAAEMENRANGMRSSYASFHLELYGSSARTAKNCGHSVTELETTYLHIQGVNQQLAKAWFSVTPAAVLAFARQEGIPLPGWSNRVV